ncbi:hypothetical protein PCANC_10258 [Puccinia coronata f. sp. avenae]|uniref:Uncharacterized protein n=1 Tax=Puccinia coronata f. sp. avenae TaxID=200324 RepID=A0A2N5VQA4_9BASI|nr:hypothetical protein PCANC_10258 [Puccinia coronata f. sp. avenae]
MQEKNHLDDQHGQVLSTSSRLQISSTANNKQSDRTLGGTIKCGGDLLRVHKSKQFTPRVSQIISNDKQSGRKRCGTVKRRDSLPHSSKQFTSIFQISIANKSSRRKLRGTIERRDLLR